MWRRWNERGGLGRFEWWTRASVYVLLAAAPVLAVVLGAQHQVRVPGLTVFLLLSVAQAAVKLGAANRHEAVQLARWRGWI
jgi:hypothetical protein